MHLRPLRPPIVLAGMAGVFFGISAFTFWYGEGASYLSNDPRACVNCHVMRDQYDAWQKSPHHAVANCNDCHVPHALIPKYLAKAQAGFWHSKGFTLQDFHEPIRIKPENLDIVNHNCVGCHRAFVNEILPSHSGAHSKLNCVRCHPGIGHGPRM